MGLCWQMWFQPPPTSLCIISEIVLAPVNTAETGPWASPQAPYPPLLLPVQPRALHLQPVPGLVEGGRSALGKLCSGERDL